MAKNKYKNITEDDAIESIKPTFRSSHVEWNNYDEFPERLRLNVQFNLRAIEETKIPLSFLYELKDNKEIVMASIRKNPNNLQFASKELRNDKKVVQLAISQGVSFVEYASDELKDDKEIITYCISQNGQTLQFASDRLKNDRELVMKAISEDSLSIKYASEELRNDMKIVLMAVNDNGQTLCYASENLRNNKEIVLAAVEKSYVAVYHMGDELMKEIGESDPIPYLKTAIFKEKLGKELNDDLNANNNESNKKLKL